MSYFKSWGSVGSNALVSRLEHAEKNVEKYSQKQKEHQEVRDANAKKINDIVANNELLPEDKLLQLQKVEAELEKNINDAIQHDIQDPLTLEPMQNPITLKRAGSTFDDADNGIWRWFNVKRQMICPLTRNRLGEYKYFGKDSSTNKRQFYIPNKKLADIINLYAEHNKYSKDLNELFLTALSINGEVFKCPWLIESGETIEMSDSHIVLFIRDKHRHPITMSKVDPKTIKIPVVENLIIKNLAQSMQVHRNLLAEISKLESKNVEVSALK